MSLDWTSIDYPLHQSLFVYSFFFSSRDVERSKPSGTQGVHSLRLFLHSATASLSYFCNLYWSFVFHLPSPISNYFITFSFVVVQLPGYKLLFSRMSLDWTSIDYPLHQSKERKQLSGTQVAHWYACFCTRQLHLFYMFVIYIDVIIRFSFALFIVQNFWGYCPS